MGREFLEFRVLRGHGWRKRELGDGGEICLGPGQAEGRFASINIVVEDIFFPDTPTLDACVGQVHFERVVRAPSVAGADEFYVVTGYQGNLVKESFEDMAARLGINLQTIHNPNRDKGIPGFAQ